MAVELLRRVPQLTLRPSPFCRECPARPYCNEQLTDLGCHPDGPNHPSLLHPASADWLDRLVEVNGVGLDYRAWKQDLPTLPPYIPIIRPSGWRDGFPTSEAIAVPLSHVESLARRVRLRGESAKTILGMSNRQPLIVLGFESDAFLESRWPSRRRRRVYEAISDIAPDAAVAWNYSVWHRHARGWRYPRIEQLYSLKRSLKIYAELQQFGIPAIPHVYWGKFEDLDRWSSWLHENPTTTTIAVDLQTVDTSQSWRDAYHTLRYLRSRLSRSVHLLINGVCRRERVLALHELWPELSVSNFAATFGNQLPYRKPYGLRQAWLSGQVEWTRQEIFQNISAQYTSMANSDASQYGRRDQDRTRSTTEVSYLSRAVRKQLASGQCAFADVEGSWGTLMSRSSA